MFNLRNLNKSNKVLEDNRFTLDSKHNEIIDNFNKERKELPKMKKEFIELANEYSIFKKKLTEDMTNNDIERKFFLKKRLKELRKKINAIENNDNMIDYYLKVGELLHDYYDNINKSSDKKEDFTLKKNKRKYKIKEPKENKKKIYSVIDFFNNRTKTENNTESSNTSFKNTKILNFIEKKESFQRANHLNDYMKKN